VSKTSASRRNTTQSSMAMADTVTEIHEILGWLLNEIARRKGGPMFSTGNARAAPSRRSSSIVAINLAEDHEMTNR
jgi:hypothetical protein